MPVLIGSVAHNQHIQNIARALFDADALAGYRSAGIDHYEHHWSRTVRELAGRACPTLNGWLARRRVHTVPENLLHSDWRWEGPRTAVHRMGVSESLEDWLWERSEFSFDRCCARYLRDARPTAFVGVEHGCLETVRVAKDMGVKTIVAFLSPHHKTLEKTVFAEYEEFPELLTPYVKRLLKRAPERDLRKDAEARLADCIHTASSFTAESLVSAGLPASKMTIVPLGCPPPIADESLPVSATHPMRFLYAGPFSVRKGAHYLLKAWESVSAGRDAELHIYGIQALPDRLLKGTNAGNVFVHGPVSTEELARAYRESAVLVFPTLCDGFGMVAMEAFANGLPVVISSNAGAADLVEEGRNGFVILPKDVDALATRIDWCMRHPADLLEMRRYALATAKRWTWAEFRAGFLAQSSRVLGNSWR